MSKEQGILAIGRRTQHDLKHVSNDGRMFEMVVELLREQGESVVEIDEDSLADYLLSSKPKRIISMAQRPENTALLAQLEAEGTIIINSFHAVLNTYRVFMALRLSEQPVPFSQTRILSSLVEEDLENFEKEAYDIIVQALGESFWLKRGDIHAAHPNDVVRVDSEEMFTKSLEDFRQRSVQAAIVQEHCEGEVVKFYAISQGRFFHVQNFQTGKPVEFDTTELQKEAERIASILDLTIYGGDVVISALGQLHFIDFNAWPSFGSVRDEAVPIMVDAILQAFEEENRIVDNVSEVGGTT